MASAARLALLSLLAQAAAFQGLRRAVALPKTRRTAAPLPAAASLALRGGAVGVGGPLSLLPPARARVDKRSPGDAVAARRAGDAATRDGSVRKTETTVAGDDALVRARHQTGDARSLSRHLVRLPSPLRRQSGGGAAADARHARRRRGRRPRARAAAERRHRARASFTRTTPAIPTPQKISKTGFVRVRAFAGDRHPVQPRTRRDDRLGAEGRRRRGPCDVAQALREGRAVVPRDGAREPSGV